jgi:hypothetical protein
MVRDALIALKLVLDRSVFELGPNPVEFEIRPGVKP